MQGPKTSSGISMASLTPTADTFVRPAGAGVARPSLLLALLFAVILTAAWTARDFTALSMGRLPDNDDMMRLAQVQDWVGGQAWSDLSQHRLGPAGGTSMHWSRIADLGPAALLVLLTPLVGAEAARLAMLVAYPALLFFLYLLVMGRIARRLAGESAGTVAVIVGALAFPSVGLFVPGRIDHHGLQILLMLLLLDAVTLRASLRSGFYAGAVAALSLAVGLETAPEIVAAMAALFVLWAARASEENGRAAGFALGLGGVTAFLLMLARPAIWPEQWCDGFTPASVAATFTAALCWGVLAAGGRFVQGWKGRVALGGVIAVAGSLVILKTSSVCFTGPYGALDPLLTRLWMDRVGEAESLFAQERIGTAVAYGGLCVVGLVAGFLCLLNGRARRPEWQALMIFLALGVVAAMLQIRVTYVMAAVAALPLIALIVAARERAPVARFPGALLLSWVAATGFTYNVAGTLLDRLLAEPAQDLRARTAACIGGDSFARIAALERGRFMAPLDSGASLIGMTPHDVVAAPYHRNNAGNLAMYRFFLAPPERARTIAAEWDVDYVTICPSSFTEIDLAREGPGSLALGLREGRAPRWLDPVPLGEGRLRVWRVKPAP
ncbi:hypothetical protein ACFQRC_12950 [Enterovirga sp. GCM10030262]|uniref:hypothetical protein n=1 Tax=Enterovirga sp. GCM10030262 TaxID=3273391 RepID=UPI003619E98D